MMRNLLVGLLVTAPLLTLAGELIVHARVVDVQPITQTERVAKEVGECDPARPVGNDLVALLAWDLRAYCRIVHETRQTVTGYRVVHVVDGRRLERIVDEPPGDTLPVRLVLH